jgi:electron transport complex protein RnfG
MLGAAILLGIFAVVGTGLVAITYEGTKERIAHNEKEVLLRSLHALIKPEWHDNDLYNDSITIQASSLLGTRHQPANIYRARLDGKPVAAVITSVAPNGYNGAIKLLVGIKYDGTLTGVRIITHRETPGLGDSIEVERSDWILGFNNRSLDNPEYSRWKVKKDGGVFDQFTGATITPRAVVKAVRDTLVYFKNNRDRIFTARTPSKKGTETLNNRTGEHHEPE